MLLVEALSGEILTAADLGEPFLRAFRYPYVVMHRNDLLTILLDACRQSKTITLETNRQVVAVDDLGDGARVKCADGSTYVCDALIGADGLGSIIRAHFFDDHKPLCEGFVAYRGAIPAEEAIEHAGPDTIRFWIGPNLHLFRPSHQVAHRERDGRRTLYSRRFVAVKRFISHRNRSLHSRAASAPRLPGL